MNNLDSPETELHEESHFPTADIAGAARRSTKEAESFIRNNPLPTILGALAIGIAVGLSVSSRRRSLTERYMEDPLGELRDLLGATGDRIYGGAKSGYEDGRSRAGKALKSFRQLF